MRAEPWGSEHVCDSSANQVPGLATRKKKRHEHLSLSYNGGKDCLVLLVLILACLPETAPRPSPGSDDAATSLPTPPTPDPDPPLSTGAATAKDRSLQAIYIVSRDPFPEVEEFVATSAEQYRLDLRRYALPMRQALEAYLEDRPAVRAIFLGTRRTDPHGEFLSHFNPTDKGWPQFMRVHPVIDWHYVEIWAVSLRSLGAGANGCNLGGSRRRDATLTPYSSYGTSKSSSATCTTGASPPWGA